MHFSVPIRTKKVLGSTDEKSPRKYKRVPPTKEPFLFDSVSSPIFVEIPVISAERASERSKKISFSSIFIRNG